MGDIDRQSMGRRLVTIKSNNRDADVSESAYRLKELHLNHLSLNPAISAGWGLF